MVSRAFIRVSILSIVVLLSIVALALGGALTSSTSSNFDATFAYASLAIAAGVISMVTIGAMIVMGMLSPGGMTSMVIFEVCWLTFLWIMWLASGITSAQMGKTYGILGGELCKDETLDKAFPVLGSICSQTTGIVALSFVIWVILLGYTIMLGVMAVSGNSGAWTGSFAQGPSSSGGHGSAAGTYNPGKDAYGSASSLKTGTVQV